jgi:hypothetical protein
MKFSTTLLTISSLPNRTSAALLTELYGFVKNNTLKTNLAFAEFIGPPLSFSEVNKRNQIISFHDSKIK